MIRIVLCDEEMAARERRRMVRELFIAPCISSMLKTTLERAALMLLDYCASRSNVEKILIDHEEL